MSFNNIGGIPYLEDYDSNLPLDKQLQAWEQKFGSNQLPPSPQIPSFHSLLKGSSKDVGKNSPFGTDSIFYVPELLLLEDFKGEFYEDFIDIQKLADDLKANLGSASFVFDYKKYISKATRVESNYHPTLMFSTSSETKADVPLTYTNDEGQKVQTYFANSKLNQLLYTLKGEITHSVVLKDGIVTFSLHFPYFDTDKYRVDAKDTEDSLSDFRQHDKFDAVILKTTNQADFFAFVLAVRDASYLPWYQKEVSKKFATFFSQVEGNIKLLKALYEQAPISALKDRSDEKKLNDIQLLLAYDKGNWLIDGWFKDSSKAMVNLLKGFTDLDKLYQFFWKNPEKLIEIYSFLSKEGQSALCQILTTITYNHKLADKNNKVDILDTFYLGKNYKIDSDVLSKDTNSTVKLNNYKLDEVIVPGYTDGISHESDTKGIKETKLLSANYHPMAMMRLVNTDTKEKETTIVPALYLKHTADTQEWADIFQTIRVCGDLLAIIMGLATLGSSNVLLVVLAAIDTTIATADLVVLSQEPELSKTEAGQKFLEAWNQISMIGGIATAGPLLIENAITYGNKLLSFAKNAKVIAFVEESLLSIIEVSRSVPKLVKGSAILVKDIIKEFGISTFSVQLKKLQEAGVVLYKGVVEGETLKSYILYFKDEVLSIGNLKQLLGDVGDLLKLKGAQLADKLEEFLLAIRKQKTFLNTSAKIGENATEDTIKWGTVKMKLHPKYEDMLKFLKDRDIIIVEIENVSKDVAYTERKILDANDNVVRVEKILEVHPEMRFLDLEHEVDHIIQFETNLEGKFCTDMKKEWTPNAPKQYINYKLGKTTELQMAFLEYETRIKELLRLKDRGLTSEILKEHLEGLKEAFNNYAGKMPKNSFDRIKFENWRREYFPEFTEFDFKNFKP